MEMAEYFDRVDDGRARCRAEQDWMNRPADFLNPDVETNPYKAMAKAYEEERQLVIKRLQEL